MWTPSPYYQIPPRCVIMLDQFIQLSLCEVHACLLCLILQYADPVADLIDKWGVFHARLFRDSCIFHRGSFVKVGQSHLHIVFVYHMQLLYNSNVLCEKKTFLLIFTIS